MPSAMPMVSCVNFLPDGPITGFPFQTARCEGYVRGNGDIERLNSLGDQIIGRVSACRDDDMTDSRIGARSYSTIGDDINRKTMTIRDALNLDLDRASIAIDIDIEQRLTPWSAAKKQNLPWQGSTLNRKRRAPHAEEHNCRPSR